MYKKVYRSKYFLSLTVCVVKAGNVVNCEFAGGIKSPQRVNGSFSTSDPETQMQLEANPRFNKDYYLLKTVEIAPAPIPVPTPIPAAIPVAENIPVVSEKEGHVSDATNAQQAREELNAKFGISFSKLKNTAAIMQFAEEYKISYPNWIKT
jgi:hypothetical protein